MNVNENDKSNNIFRYKRDFGKQSKGVYSREKWKIWEILIIKIITYTLRKSIENNFHSEKKILSLGWKSEWERESSSSLTKFISPTTDNFSPAK